MRKKRKNIFYDIVVVGAGPIGIAFACSLTNTKLKIAIVDKSSGITRDRHEAKGRLGDLNITFIDTAGFEDRNDDSLASRIRDQTNRAVKKADVALFLIDARSGLTSLDEHFAHWLRRQDVPRAYNMTTVAYVTRPSFIMNNEKIWDGNVQGVLIPPERAIDIDTEYDLKIAELILNNHSQIGTSYAKG